MAELGDVLESHGLADSSLHRLGDGTSYYLEVPGREVIARWSALRNIFDETGYWPVLLGGDAWLGRWLLLPLYVAGFYGGMVVIDLLTYPLLERWRAWLRGDLQMRSDLAWAPSNIAIVKY